MSSKKSVKSSDNKHRSYKHCADWEKETWAKGWLTKSKDFMKQAHCLVCNKNYRVHHKDLEEHATMVAHVQNMDCIHVKQTKISDVCDTNYIELYNTKHFEKLENPII